MHPRAILESAPLNLRVLTKPPSKFVMYMTCQWLNFNLHGLLGTLVKHSGLTVTKHNKVTMRQASCSPGLLQQLWRLQQWLCCELEGTPVNTHRMPGL